MCLLGVLFRLMIDAFKIIVSELLAQRLPPQLAFEHAAKRLRELGRLRVYHRNASVAQLATPSPALALQHVHTGMHVYEYEHQLLIPLPFSLIVIRFSCECDG
jgi:hypothetical protein